MEQNQAVNISEIDRKSDSTLEPDHELLIIIPPFLSQRNDNLQCNYNLTETITYSALNSLCFSKGCHAEQGLYWGASKSLQCADYSKLNTVNR